MLVPYDDATLGAEVIRRQVTVSGEQLVDALGRLGLVPAEQAGDDGDVVGHRHVREE